MQAFKLVNGGFVDRVIVFDSLPDRLLKNVRTREIAGFPRAWGRWLGEIGSTRPVFKTETVQHPDRSYTFKYTPVGKEPCFFVLEYTDLNADKDRWREICEYLRLNVGPEVRLKEKIEDMARPLAPNSTSQLDVEPEDIPVIHVPSEIAASVPEVVMAGEQIIVNEPVLKKRGRPKKAEVA
jgi:hypothetical protein